MTKIIFEKAAYPEIDVEVIKADLVQQGYEPFLIEEKPDGSLAAHQHQESHILVQIGGEMEIISDSKTIKMHPGDKLTIPPEVEHGAKFGYSGSKYLWVEF